MAFGLREGFAESGSASGRSSGGSFRGNGSKVVFRDRILSQMTNRVDENFVITDFKDSSVSFSPTESVSELSQFARQGAGFRDQRLPFRIPCKASDRCFKAFQPTDRLLR